MDVGSRPGDAPSPVGAGQPTGTPTSEVATTSRPTVNVALSLLGFLVALLVAWAIANPFGGFPDELDHYVRSVSISQGQWVGQPGPLAPQPAVRWGVMLVITVSLCALVGVVLAPNFERPHRGNNLTACKSNCKNIATALEMYASDNKGQYPKSLDGLFPKSYLRRIPSCPSSLKTTFVFCCA